MYQALYRKWRPQTFSDVIGQAHITDTLKNQILSERVSHAYLFCGSRGTGKTTTAKIFSRAVNCLNPIDGNPCNECAACLGILSGSNIDVIEIDAASNNKVDDIREIRDEVIYPPADVKYKVYIIDEAHMLTTSAFNALLKTLEEPPAYVIFILATTEFHKIPATILSRCQKFDFKRITYKDTAKRIMQVVEKDGLTVSPEGVKLLSKAADGSIRDALSILDQCISSGKSNIEFDDIADILGASDPEFISELGNAIIDEDISKTLLMVNEAVYNGTDILKLSDDLIEYFRNMMVVKTTRNPQDVLDMSEEGIIQLETSAKKIPLNRILQIIEVLFETMSYAKFVTNPKIALETAMLKIAAKQTDRDLDGILNRLEILEQKIDKAPVIQEVSQPVKEIPVAEVIEEGISLDELLEEQAVPIWETQTEEEPEESDYEIPEETELEAIETAENAELENEVADDIIEELQPVGQLDENNEEDSFEGIEDQISNIVSNSTEEPNVADEEIQVNPEPEEIPAPSFDEGYDDFIPMEDADLAKAFESFVSETEAVQEAEEAHIHKTEENEALEKTTDEVDVSDVNLDSVIDRFAEIISDAAADADFAFRGIMERAKVEKGNGNHIRVIFQQNSLYHIAKMSKYDTIIMQSVKRMLAVDILVDLEESGKEKVIEKKDSGNTNDLLENVIQKIKEDDEIRFQLD